MRIKASSLVVLVVCHFALLVSACNTQGRNDTADSPVIAIKTPGELTYFARRLSEEQLVELRVLAPNVRFEQGLSPAELQARAGEAHGVDASLCKPEFLESANQLRWTQAWSAGVDHTLRDGTLLAKDELVLTNMAGVHGPAIADHAMGMLLALTRGAPIWRDAMKRGEWNRSLAPEMTALHGRTMFVVGLGGIGSEIARRARGFGMRVVATVRTQRATPEFVDELGLANDLARFLATADVVAVCVPLTDATRGLFDVAQFAQMKRGAYLINIARGPIVNTNALLAALESDHLAGACLDVTDPEPLPSDHPLWQREDVMITPHIAGRAEVTAERRWALFRENVRRFGAGEPLLNVVDKQAGY